MKRLLIIVFLILAIQLQAQERIGEKEAFVTAERFLTQQDGSKSKLSLSQTIDSKLSGQPNLFVFSSEPKGFIIVSAWNEVLAYSLDSNLSTSDEFPSPAAYWIDLYNEQTDYLLQHPEPFKGTAKDTRSVQPLLTSQWGQGCYYNEGCPIDTLGPCQHASAGCVAIAMAQIMYYHKHPIIGNGEITYSDYPYGTLNANFGETTYLWDEMTDIVQQSNPAVAQLVAHCGIAVMMQYGPLQSESVITNANNAFKQFFDYPTTLLHSRSDSNYEDWKELIKHDLDQGLPVYYRGISSSGGHAFVCDGYDTNDLFHFNFGWNGVADGYFTLASPYGFSETQSIICRIISIPNIPLHSDNHGIIHVTPDGTGDGSSWEQATSELQLAIYKSYSDNCTIWVKEGNYKGDPFEEYAFYLPRNTKLYGGFKGDEPFDYDLSLRDFENHPSILDGNNRQGVINVQTDYANDSVLIDGFTICNGYADRGGGILVRNKANIRNCKICDNHALSLGGGVYDIGSASFLHCHIHNNESQKNGGGIYCSNSEAPSLYINCEINNNSALLGGGAFSTNASFLQCNIHHNTAHIRGGGIACFESSNTLWNCLVNNNTAQIGGGCYLERGVHVSNCTVVKNEALEDFGGLYSNTQNEIWNCIVWGNTCPGLNAQIGPDVTYYHCAVQEDRSFLGSNFNAASENDGESPGFYIRFIDPNVTEGCSGLEGDWRLQLNSMCVDMGESVVNQPSVDFYGNPRLKHQNVDIGAFESNSAAILIEKECEDLPFNYNGTLLSEIGSYSFFFPGNPYDSLVIFRINDEGTFFLEEEICESEAYDFFGSMLTETGQYHHFEDCTNYLLDLTVRPLPIVSMKESICDNETYDFFGTTLHQAGQYTHIENCKKYQLDLKVIPTDTVPLEKTICEGESYIFFGKPLRETGFYSTLVDCRAYELSLTVTPLPQLHCSTDTIVDYGHPVQLCASGADTYLWSTGDTTACIILLPKQDNVYSVTGYNTNGCHETTSVRVRVTNTNLSDLVLFPNPAKDKVIVNMYQIKAVEIINLYGVLMEHFESNQEALEMDVSHYPSGVYYIHVIRANNHYYAKLIIQH